MNTTQKIVLTISIVSLIVSIVVAVQVNNKKNELSFIIEESPEPLVTMWEDENYIYWGKYYGEPDIILEKDTGNIGIGDEGKLLKIGLEEDKTEP